MSARRRRLEVVKQLRAHRRCRRCDRERAARARSRRHGRERAARRDEQRDRPRRRRSSSDVPPDFARRRRRLRAGCPPAPCRRRAGRAARVGASDGASSRAARARRPAEPRVRSRDVAVRPSANRGVDAGIVENLDAAAAGAAREQTSVVPVIARAARIRRDSRAADARCSGSARSTSAMNIVWSPASWCAA